MSVYADVLRYRDLFVNLFRRDLNVRYRGSVLGLGWTLVNPLVLVGVYTLVFKLLWGSLAIPHYPLFVCSGLVLWLFFTSTVTMASPSLVSQAYLVQQVRFPRQLLPLSVVATNAVTLLAMLAIVVPLDLALIPAARSTFWAGLAMVVPLIAFASGLAVAIACLTVAFRDVEHVLQAVFLPWFFLTPIFYRFEDLPGVSDHDTLASILFWGNPLTPMLSAIRDPLWQGTLPDPRHAAYACVAAVLALALGALVFRRADDQLAAQL